MQIKKSGYILNFLKFIDKDRDQPTSLAQWDQTKEEIENLAVEGIENRRFVLKCLNQYDVFRFSETVDLVEDIDSLLNQRLSSYALADRRTLGYMCEGDSNVKDISDVFLGNNFITIILVKIRNNINVGSLKEENATIKLFNKILSDKFPSIKYLSFRTFSNKEIFFIINSTTLLEAEAVVHLLQSASLYPRNKSKAFSIVNRWICCNGPNVNDDSHFKGKLKLYGICNQTYDKRFSCLSVFPPKKIHEQRPVCCSEDEAIKSTCEITSDYSRIHLTVNEIVNKIFTMKCSGLPHCAVSVSFLLPHDENLIPNKRKNGYFLFDSKADCTTFRSKHRLVNFFDSFNDFDSLDVEGFSFHKIQLNKITKFITRKLRNHFQRTEYEDVISIFYNLKEHIEWDAHLRNKVMPPEEKNKRLQYNLTVLNDALPLLEYVGNERERPTLCSSWYDDGYYKSEVSGFSKISNAASFLISSTVNRTWNGRKIDYQGLCTFGYLPSFKHRPELSIVNSDFRAVLSPKHHFGIYHEAGHILETEMELDKKLQEISKLAMHKCEHKIESMKILVTEIFADLFSYLFAITDLDINIDNHLSVFIDNLSYDLEDDYTLSIAALSDKCMERSWRFTSVIMANKLINSNELDTVYDDFHEQIYDLIAASLDYLCEKVTALNNTRDDTVTFALLEIIFDARKKFKMDKSRFKEVGSEYLNLSNLHEVHKSYYTVYTLTKSLLKDVLKKGNFGKTLNYAVTEEEAAIENIRESIISSHSINQPQQIINYLLETDNNVFSVNVAAIISLANNFSRESFINHFSKERKTHG